MRYRNKQQAEKKENHIITVGKNFKPKIKFKEQEMQSLYDKAD